jgi:hypothetical protein
MRFLFQRIVHNANRWTRPSNGRLGSKLDGGYLNETGFGHEDWNLCNDRSQDGYVHGYVYFRPKSPSGLFNILFATYDKGEGWALIGFYERASFDPSGAKFSSTILRRRARELKDLDEVGSLGPPYAGLSPENMLRRLASEEVFYRWRVRLSNVHTLQAPLLLPERLVASYGKYFARPTEISQNRYDEIIAFAQNYSDKAPEQNYQDGGDIEFPEGRKYQVLHTARERNRSLVNKAKQRFKRRHGRLFCEACKFDFMHVYGLAGEDFIEVHHLRPVSELRPGARTRLDDLALVCSNCHRMLHRRRPWMTISVLRRLLRNPT